MKFVSLCIKEENLDIADWMINEQEELEDYFNFVLTLTDKQEIKDRMIKMKEDLICYVVDAPGRTKIPRVLEGEDRSFILPVRAAAFVREQNIVENNDSKYYETKCGFAYRKKDSNPGIKFHEMNHNLSRQLSMQISDGEIMKSGTNIQILDLGNDKFISRTGNFLDEAITDAIAKYYYDKKYEKQEKPEYTSEYSRQGMTLFAQILLGENLSNKDLINAYLGSPEDLIEFKKKFKATTNFDFGRILKMHWDGTKSIDNENIPIEELIKLAVTYHINSATSEVELETEIAYLQSLNIVEELKQCCADDIIEDIKSFLNNECINARDKFKSLVLY